MSNGEDLEYQLSETAKELEIVKKELKSLKDIMMIASWTCRGSRIYKDPAQCSVSQEFYFLLTEAYKNYENEFGKFGGEY